MLDGDDLDDGAAQPSNPSGQTTPVGDDGVQSLTNNSVNDSTAPTARIVSADDDDDAGVNSNAPVAPANLQITPGGDDDDVSLLVNGTPTPLQGEIDDDGGTLFVDGTPIANLPEDALDDGGVISVQTPSVNDSGSGGVAPDTTDPATNTTLSQDQADSTNNSVIGTPEQIDGQTEPDLAQNIQIASEPVTPPSTDASTLAQNSLSQNNIAPENDGNSADAFVGSENDSFVDSTSLETDTRSGNASPNSRIDDGTALDSSIAGESNSLTIDSLSPTNRTSIESIDNANLDVLGNASDSTNVLQFQQEGSLEGQTSLTDNSESLARSSANTAQTNPNSNSSDQTDARDTSSNLQSGRPLGNSLDGPTVGSGDSASLLSGPVSGDKANKNLQVNNLDKAIETTEREGISNFDQFQDSQNQRSDNPARSRSPNEQQLSSDSSSSRNTIQNRSGSSSSKNSNADLSNLGFDIGIDLESIANDLLPGIPSLNPPRAIDIDGQDVDSSRTGDADTSESIVTNAIESISVDSRSSEYENFETQPLDQARSATEQNSENENILPPLSTVNPEVPADRDQSQGIDDINKDSSDANSDLDDSPNTQNGSNAKQQENQRSSFSTPDSFQDRLTISVVELSSNTIIPPSSPSPEPVGNPLETVVANNSVQPRKNAETEPPISRPNLAAYYSTKQGSESATGAKRSVQGVSKSHSNPSFSSRTVPESHLNQQGPRPTKFESLETYESSREVAESFEDAAGHMHVEYIPQQRSSVFGISKALLLSALTMFIGLGNSSATKKPFQDR